MPLHVQILIGLAAGAAAGATANLAGAAWLRSLLVGLEPVGAAFIRLITMIVVPLVVASIIVGVSSLGDLKRLGRIGGKAVGYYLFTTVAAIVLGLMLANLVKPGSRIDAATRDALAEQFASEAAAQSQRAHQAPALRDTLLGIIPRNPVRAAADFELLPLIFFSVVFGAAIGQLRGDSQRAVIQFFSGVSDAAAVVIGWIMRLAPYAVFVLIAAVVARFGFDLLGSLLVYAATVLIGLALHQFVTLALLVRLLARLDPRDFFRRTAAVQLFAFTTSSSNATLPLTLETAERRLGIPKSIAGFVLPLGATVNMNGTALYQAIAVMFIAQIYGAPMDLAAQLTIVVTATLAAIGAAGVPAAGIITLIIVLESVGLGGRIESGIALILGVDRILDMARTIVNVLGDLTCAAFVARSEGELSE
jgi:DAACS family dicarboxylate/amino acid:cation (Na+ or H+) symporter